MRTRVNCWTVVLAVTLAAIFWGPISGRAVARDTSPPAEMLPGPHCVWFAWWSWSADDWPDGEDDGDDGDDGDDSGDDGVAGDKTLPDVDLGDLDPDDDGIELYWDDDEDRDDEDVQRRSTSAPAVGSKSSGPSRGR